MGAPLSPKYIPYTYIDPLGYTLNPRLCASMTLAGVRSSEFQEVLLAPWVLGLGFRV